MSERDQKHEVEQWVAQQPTIPGRKAVQKQFPNTPQRIIKQVLQSAEDRAGTPSRG